MGYKLAKYEEKKTYLHAVSNQDQWHEWQQAGARVQHAPHSSTQPTSCANRAKLYSKHSLHDAGQQVLLTQRHRVVCCR